MEGIDELNWRDHTVFEVNEGQNESVDEL